MSEEDRILVAVLGKTVYVKPFGDATQSNCLGLPDFLKAMFREGCTGVAFDLAECTRMDSTFLGVIASAAIPAPHEGGKAAVILNADDHARRDLRMIGLMAVVAVKEEPCEPPPGLELSPIDFVHLPATERERVRKIMDLHEQLTRLNEKNSKKFGPFVRMIGEELQQG